MRKMQIAQAKWAPLLADPYMNPVEVRKALLEGFGEKDPDRFLNPMAVQAMQGGDGLGQPGVLPPEQAMAPQGQPQQAA